MPPSIVLVCGPVVPKTTVMHMLHLLAGSGCVIVHPPSPPPDFSPEKLCALASSLDDAQHAFFEPKETAWERRNRNAPWYRKFQRRRR